MLMPPGIHIFRAFTGQDFPERTGVVPWCCRRNLPALLYMAVNLEAMTLFQFWQPVCEIGVTERDVPGFVPRNCARDADQRRARKSLDGVLLKFNCLSFQDDVVACEHRFLPQRRVQQHVERVGNLRILRADIANPQ